MAFWSPASSDFLPNNLDRKFHVYLVGAGLCPGNPAEYVTLDMCTPIFPNTSHPSGRTPVVPVPTFPFSNCYHWIGPDMVRTVRVKTRAYLL